MGELSQYPSTIIILITTVIVSLRCFNRPGLFHKLKGFPFGVKRHQEWYRLLSSGFVHGGMLHLIINMFVLYEFGRFVEQLFIHRSGGLMGSVYFMLIYLLSLILSSLPSYFKHQDNAQYSAVGASGAVSGILFIFVLLDPWHTLLLYFIIPAPGILIAVLYLIYSSWASKNRNDNIGHDAHFFGALSGAILACLFYPALLGNFIYKLVNEFPF